VPFPVLLSTRIRSRFQAKPATLLIPIAFPFLFAAEELYGTRYQSGSFSLIYVGTGFHCLCSYLSFFLFRGAPESRGYKDYKDGLQPETLADGNWLVKQNQPVSKIETKSDRVTWRLPFKALATTTAALVTLVWPIAFLNPFLRVLPPAQNALIQCEEQHRSNLEAAIQGSESNRDSASSLPGNASLQEVEEDPFIARLRSDASVARLLDEVCKQSD